MAILRWVSGGTIFAGVDDWGPAGTGRGEVLAQVVAEAAKKRLEIRESSSMHEPLKRLPQRQEDPERYPRHIEAPAFGDILPPAIFLAGGITGCPDWQAEAITLFRGAKATVVNPRRRCPPPRDFEGAKEQISWEVFYLNRADLVLFWFPASWAVQPIALYELGKIAASSKPIAVGADPGYQRRVDVILQLSHARPGVEVHTTLAETVDDARRLLAAANPGPLRSGGSGGG